MTREEFRLECLKLTYTHGRDSAEAVARAKDLEKYIFEKHLEEELFGESATIKAAETPKKTGTTKSR